MTTKHIAIILFILVSLTYILKDKKEDDHTGKDPETAESPVYFHLPYTWK